MSFALACTCFALACGGDDGGGEDADAAGDLTLEDALKTAGTNTSDERAELVVEAACKEQVKCEPDPTCADGQLGMWNAEMANRSDACLDATLDLYACFATTPCADYDQACDPAGQHQKDECGGFD